jgi:regulator of CtrA degradation
MAETADLNPTIVEALYGEALALADRARDTFDLSGRITTVSENEDLARIALSCEALRTTTRMMHAIAWLLNQRAHFAGELSELQLRRHGRLPRSQAETDPDQLALLSPAVNELIERSRLFYARIQRLDDAMYNHSEEHPMTVHHLRDRLGKAVNAL